MEDAHQNFGNLFRSVREQAGRQLSDVAAELHINAQYLEALEDEDFDHLPSESFARGYIRAYARALETDPQPLLDAYSQSAPAPAAWHANQPLEEQTQPSRLPLMLGTAAVAATVVTLFVIWFLGSGYVNDLPSTVDQSVEDEAESPKAPEAAVNLEKRSPPPDALGVTDRQDDKAAIAVAAKGLTNEHHAAPASHKVDSNASDSNALPETVADKNAAGAVSADTESKREAVTSEEKEQPSSRVEADDKNPDLLRAPAGDDKVEITLNDDSWVDIKDANGERLLRGLYLKGASKTLIGKAPFQVFLGNAPAVTLQAAGKPVDISGFVRANKTARFVVLQKTEK